MINFFFLEPSPSPRAPPQWATTGFFFLEPSPSPRAPPQWAATPPPRLLPLTAFASPPPAYMEDVSPPPSPPPLSGGAWNSKAEELAPNN